MAVKIRFTNKYFFTFMLEFIIIWNAANVIYIPGIKYLYHKESQWNWFIISIFFGLISLDCINTCRPVLIPRCCLCSFWISYNLNFPKTKLWICSATLIIPFYWLKEENTLNVCVNVILCQKFKRKITFEESNHS